MSRTVSSIVAWAAAALSVGLATTAIWLTLTLVSAPDALAVAAAVLFRVWSLVFAPVGLLILTKRPENRIGWVALAMALSSALTAVFGDLRAAIGGQAPGPIELGLLSDISWLVSMSMLGWFFLLFPTGRLPSRRWRPLGWALALWPPVLLLTAVLAPVTMQGGASVPNPFLLIEGAVGSALNLVLVLVAFLLLPLLIGVVLAAFVRFLHSRGVERQQLKWFAYAAAVFGLVFSLSAIVPSPAVQVGVSITFFGLPIAVAIAILRYRLYDIDLLINRTLVYGATSAAIATTFFLGIVALQGILRPITSGSELAVAASTLVSFALFQPIRRSVQSAVDHRFDRSRYDAAHTLDAFADDLRDEVDLDTLRSDLLGAVSRTMSPAHASLWLREHRR